jgi:hypothetical protein
MTAQAPAGKIKPLRVSENGRFFVEDGGKPFFILADTAWALFTGISREDVEFYLDDRQAKGFNTILCSLLHFWPSRQNEWAPKHRVYGFWAFDGDHYDLSRPNRQYWEHVDWVMQQARRRSLRLAVVPCWFRRRGEAWKVQLTPDTATRFGEYLGLRCCQYNNVIWLFGGDYPPMEKRRELRLLAEAIRYYAPHHLISYQANADSSSGAFSHAERWLAFNSIQTNGKEHPGEYALVREDWHRVPAKPTWLAEAYYERPGSRFAVRQAAWRSVLTGGAGFGYGVENVFDLGYSNKWKEHLDMPGSGDVVFMLGLLQSQPWHRLVPDHAAKNKLLVAVETQKDIYFASACSADGDVGVIYLPVRTTIAVNMGLFNGPVMGRWFNPSNADSVDVEGSPFMNSGIRALRPPKPDGTAETDLVLVLTAESATETGTAQTTELGIAGDQ